MGIVWERPLAGPGGAFRPFQGAPSQHTFWGVLGMGVSKVFLGGSETNWDNGEQLPGEGQRNIATETLFIFLAEANFYLKSRKCSK